MPTRPSRLVHSSRYEVIDDFIKYTNPLSPTMFKASRTRSPIYLWPAMDLAENGKKALRHYIEQLDMRGVGYVSTWNPESAEQSIDSSLMAAEILAEIGQSASIHITPCVNGIFDGGEDTLHIDVKGERYADESFGESHTMGCPFAISRTRKTLTDRMNYFVSTFAESGFKIGFAFADWEIDGPIEWNGAWEASKNCITCKKHIGDIPNFSSFQQALRHIRAEIMRDVISQPVLSRFPKALVMNYGVYPHDGYRYWYDHYEQLPPKAVGIRVGNAIMRPWVHEYTHSGFTAGMPVVYNWQEMWEWTDSPLADARWMTSSLKVADNAGRAAGDIPTVTFVHRGIVGENKELNTKISPIPLARKSYRDLLGHILLRGHDTIFVWTPLENAIEECLDAYASYAESLPYAHHLANGTPCLFGPPDEHGTVVSAVILAKKALVYKSSIGEIAGSAQISIGGKKIMVKKDGYSLITIT